MLRTGISRAWMASALLVALPSVAADNYTIDGSHSQVVFKVGHLGVSNNYGRFNDLAGSYTLDGANSKIEITIKAESVDTANAKRDEHIKSPDFFNAKQFPTITFKSTSVKPGSGNDMAVTGDLTFLGVTKPVSFTATKIGEGDDPWGGHRSGFEATIKIKRGDFGSTKMVGPVGDEVTLLINIEGTRNK